MVSQRIQDYLQAELHKISPDNLIQPAFVIATVDIQGASTKYSFHAIGHAQEPSQKGFAPVLANDDTVFSIASSSKSFNAMTIALCIEEGLEFTSLFTGKQSRLTFDTLVKEVLPDFEMHKEAEHAQANLKLRDLLCHRSGLPGHIPALGAHDTYDDVLQRYRTVRPTASIREKAQYENSGIILSAKILEHVTGKPLSTNAQRLIFDPLKMSSTTYFPSSAEFGGDRNHPNTQAKHVLAHAYGRFTHNDGIKKIRRVPFWLDREVQNKNGTFQYEETCLKTQSAPGGVCASAKDLSKWTECLLRQGKSSEGSTLLASNAIDVTTQGYSIFQGRAEGKDSIQLFGLGFWTVFVNGQEVIRHDGGQRGVGARIGFCPVANLGIVLLSNVDYSEVTGIHDVVVQMLMEERGFTSSIPKSITPELPDENQAISKRDHVVKVEPEVISDLCGVYRSPWGTVTLESTSKPGTAINRDFALCPSLLDDSALFAVVDRFWITHFRLRPIAANPPLFEIDMMDFYPRGCGLDTTPSYKFFGSPHSHASFVYEANRVKGMLFNGVYDSGYTYPGSTEAERAEITWERLELNSTS